MARTEGFWTKISNFIQTDPSDSVSLLISGINKYINFGSFSGSSGYGIRDNSGVIEIKNSGGTWSPVSTGPAGSIQITAGLDTPVTAGNEGDVYLLTSDGATTGVVIRTFVYDGATWVETTEPSYLKFKNLTGGTVNKGKIVYVNGANGGNPTIALADNTTESTSSKTIGIVTKNTLDNEVGYFITEGELDGVDTSTFSAGQVLWLGTSGNITATKPAAPNHSVFIGYCLTSASNGKILVKIQNGYELDELHNVLITSPTNNQVLSYNATTGLWENKTPSSGSSIQPVITVTSSQSVSTNQHIRADASLGNITLTLTNPSQEETVTIKKIDSSTNSVFVTSPSLIDGSTIAELSMEEESITLKFTGITYDIT